MSIITFGDAAHHRNGEGAKCLRRDVVESSEEILFKLVQFFVYFSFPLCPERPRYSQLDLGQGISSGNEKEGHCGLPTRLS